MQTVKPVVLFMLAVLLISAYKPMNKPVKGTRWLTLEEVSLNVKKEKRPILIDLYTDWCGWCGVMDKKTYGNKKVAEYLSARFYPVKIDAESKKNIVWENRTFRFNPAYNTNDFAIFLTGGKLSYPTTVIIPAEGGEPQVIPGYLNPAEFEVILKFFGEGHYKTNSFDTFHKKFKTSW